MLCLSFYHDFSAIGLSEDDNTKAIGFENMGEQSGGETRMVDVSIAHYEDSAIEDDIDGVPAA